MKPFEAYCIHNAVHLHFISDYDCFKYRFKTRVTEKAFYKRNDRYFFAKAASNYNTLEKLVEFYGSQYADGDTKKHISSFFKEEGDARWSLFQKKMQSFSYNVSNQLSGLNVDHFDDMFINNGMYPLIIQEWMSGKIDSETIVALDQLINFIDGINTTDTLLWPEKKKFLKKYSPFVKTDLEKLKKVILKVFTI